MTKHASDSSDRPALTKEVQITPEMIAAGVKELVIDSASSDEEIVTRVLAAVLEAGGYQVKELA